VACIQSARTVTPSPGVDPPPVAEGVDVAPGLRGRLASPRGRATRRAAGEPDQATLAILLAGPMVSGPRLDGRDTQAAVTLDGDRSAAIGLGLLVSGLLGRPELRGICSTTVGIGGGGKFGHDAWAPQARRFPLLRPPSAVSADDAGRQTFYSERQKLYDLPGQHAVGSVKVLTSCCGARRCEPKHFCRPRRSDCVEQFVRDRDLLRQIAYSWSFWSPADHTEGDATVALRRSARAEEFFLQGRHQADR
jgi:hypothetical protein